MRLIDTAKDTRITHLLRQTDAYLDSLAQAVVAQQNETGPAPELAFEQEEGPAAEATFGAQIAQDDINEDKTKVDYYAVAHRISDGGIPRSPPASPRGSTLAHCKIPSAVVPRPNAAAYIPSTPPPISPRLKVDVDLVS